MFKLEKNVPFTGARQTWPFKTMASGDSFAIPSDDHTIQKARLAAGAYASKHKADGVRFTVRRQEDGTARCWRVA